MSLPDRDVLLCRGCCCGTAEKHPSTDHDAQRDALLGCDGSDGVRVRVVDCLDRCDRSNVVLVRDFTGGRRPHDTWLGGVLNPRATEHLVTWVQDGGALPRELAPHRFGTNTRGRA
jgi:predicted metal-binding protein